jgi:hypothetical protein
VSRHSARNAAASRPSALARALPAESTVTPSAQRGRSTARHTAKATRADVGRRNRRAILGRLGVIGAMVCCDVVLSAAGTHSAVSTGGTPRLHQQRTPATAALPASTAEVAAGGSPRLTRPPGTRHPIAGLPSQPADRTAAPASRTARTATPPITPPTTAAGRSPVTSAPPPKSPPSAAKPGPTTTGVPAGTRLTRYDGTLVITQPGATYDGLDIHGFVIVMAANVTIRRSVIRGGVPQRRGPSALVTNTDARAANFVLEDCDLAADQFSEAFDGIQGSNFTVLRTNIHDVAHGATIFGDNVTIERSWLHSFASYGGDPYWRNRRSDNRAIRILSGHHIVITDNTIED